MGGHIQYGEFKVLTEAVNEWQRARREYEDVLHLWLKLAQITWDDKDRKYKLAMRFAK